VLLESGSRNGLAPSLALALRAHQKRASKFAPGKFVNPLRGLPYSLPPQIQKGVTAKQSLPFKFGGAASFTFIA